MTLTIELTPEEETRLVAAARQKGLESAEFARRVLTEHLLPTPGQATRDLLRAWREEDATENPEEVLAAEEELEAFKKAMNAERVRAGARPLYP